MSHDTDRERKRWTAWPRIAVAIAVVVVSINVLAVAVVAATPERCMSCHGASGDALEVRDSHAAIRCLECHGGTSAIETVGFAGRQVYGMYLGLPIFADRSAAAVSDVACSRCHGVAARPSDTGALRMNHATCVAERQCTDCHSRVAHGDSVTWPREYDMFECVSCHMSQATSVECDLCHTERSREERIRTGSFALTHAANWRETHGMGDSLACAACHPSDKCVNCHGVGVPHGAAFARSHSGFAVQEGAQCASCHSQRFCDDCHGLEMPHPAEFTPQHAAIVAENGQALCENCHAQSDCRTCHVKHVHPGNAKAGGGD